MKLLVIVFILLTGCQSVPYQGYFNHEEEQDSDCLYNRYGGMYGYCGKQVDR